MAAGTDDCFAVVTNSLAAYFAAIGADIVGVRASDWSEPVHDAVGGAE